MLWLIELKFCISLCFTVLQIKFECRQFASIFVGVMPLLEYTILKNTQFSALFSYTLWHIDLKFCISLCFTVLQIKFECCQLPSNFVGVMPLLDLEYWKIHSFPLFFYMLWNIRLKFYIWLCLTVLQIKFECCQFPSFFDGVIPLSEWWIRKFTIFRTFLLHALTY